MATKDLPTKPGTVDEYPIALTAPEDYRDWVDQMAIDVVESSLGAALDAQGRDVGESPNPFHYLAPKTNAEVADKIHVLSQRGHQIAYDVLKYTPEAFEIFATGESKAECDNAVQNAAHEVLVREVLNQAADYMEEVGPDYMREHGEFKRGWMEIEYRVPI